MLKLTDYLEEIRKDKTAGWSRVYKDILGQPLYDKARFLKAVELYGDIIILESLVITASKKLKTDPLNYFLAVANQRWREEMQREISSDEEAIKANKAIERTKEAGEQLAEKIERAKRRNNDTTGSI